MSPQAGRSVLVVALYCCCVVPAAVGAAEYSPLALATHLDTLLAEYERDAPPAPRVQVALALDVRHASVDDAGATMRLLADLKMSWSDPRTSWNASSWGGESVLVSAERLWVPDVGPVGGSALAAGAGGGGAAPARARLSNDGAVSLVARLDLTVPLALQLYHWPRDEQVAVYEFASREYSQDELDLVIGDFKNAVVVECGAWEVARVAGTTRAWRRGGGGVASVAAWSVRAARRGGALRVAAGAALLAADLLLAAAAARPAAARAPLTAAAAALCAGWLVAAMFHVPAGEGAPLAVRLVAAGCVAAAAAGAGAALAGRVARRTAPPSAALRALLSRVSAVYALTPAPHSECGAAGGECGAWAAAAALLDAVLLALLLLALLVITLLFFF